MVKVWKDLTHPKGKTPPGDTGSRAYNRTQKQPGESPGERLPLSPVGPGNFAVPQPPIPIPGDEAAYNQWVDTGQRTLRVAEGVVPQLGLNTAVGIGCSVIATLECHLPT